MVDYLWVVPLIAGVLTTISVVIVFVISTVATHHNKSPAPSLSDLTALQPESCVFSILIAISTFFIFFSIWLKYQHVSAWLRNRHEVNISNANFILKWIGWTACLGLILHSHISANVYTRVNLVGAWTAQICSAVYTMGQAVITYYIRAKSNHSAPLLAHSRFFIAWINCVAAITGIVTGVLQWNSHLLHTSPRNILKKHSGFGMHVVCVISQWVVLYGFILIVTTFAFDLREVKIQPFRMDLIEEERKKRGRRRSRGDRRRKTLRSVDIDPKVDSLY